MNKKTPAYGITTRSLKQHIRPILVSMIDKVPGLKNVLRRLWHRYGRISHGYNIGLYLSSMQENNNSFDDLASARLMREVIKLKQVNADVNVFYLSKNDNE